MALLPNITEQQKKEVFELHDIFKTITEKFTAEYSGSFPYLYNAKDKLFIDSSHPNKDLLKKETNSLIQGMLAVYFFAVWDELMPNWNEYGSRTIEDYIQEEEKLQLQAYRHVRHIAAHKMNGERANNAKSKFNEYFELNPNFSSINWHRENDRIDLSESSVGADIADFMKNLSIKISFRVLDEINEVKSIF